ncbi:capsid assembly protein [Desulfovibrio oxyclinae]|uniref:capsid assembly protein n=1 Tax=Desulfovibrio oxyclinae TaxID=63560 RepID=UPI000367A025|nr:hypothetical protein [Desulfovibrio oxyclinae]
MSDNPHKVEVPADVTGPDAPSEEQNGSEDHLYAGKFKSVEDMEKAYNELQSLLGKRDSGDTSSDDAAPTDGNQEQPNETPDNSEDKPKEKSENQDDVNPAFSQVSEVLKGAGLDMTEFSKEFEENGQLSEESYRKLAEAGFGKELVDHTIGSLLGSNEVAEQLAETQIKDVKATVGGDEGYSKLMQWAKVNLSQSEQERYDKIMSSGDLDLIKMTVSGLKARYDADFGIDPKLRGGRGKGSPAKDVFRSSQEVVEAMRDPRYGKDPAYTQEIAEKVARSDVF